MGEGGIQDTFGNVAVELGLLTPEQLDEGLETKRAAGPAAESTPIGDFLINKGILDREQVHQVLLEQQRRLVTAERRIGNYEIIEKVGAGGMGSVYRARDLRDGRICALKILPPSLAKDDSYVKRFIHEAALASKIFDHDHIVKGFGAGQADGFFYFVMEFVDGENIHQMLDRVGRFPEDTALKTIVPIARALQHAHFHGLVHQDVKPENIIIDRKGTAKLLDLGLARRAGDMTTRMGTPLYVSPEQIKGDRAIDVRSDIYSLGVTLYHMLTGAPPFSGSSDKDTLQLHLEEEVPWPQDVVPELSNKVCLVISRMLAKDADERYTNPKEVLYDMESILDGRPIKFAIEGPKKAPPPQPAPAAPVEPRRQSHGRERRRKRSRPQRPAAASPVWMYAIAGGLVIFAIILAIIIKSRG
jgi:serine/threonine-protein kinase